MARRTLRRPADDDPAGRRACAAMRRQRIRRIRRRIRDGDYENDLKLSIAIDRLLDALAPRRH